MQQLALVMLAATAELWRASRALMLLDRPRLGKS
jgi:hypothetical protein